jgi:hypothetical protein
MEKRCILSRRCNRPSCATLWCGYTYNVTWLLTGWSNRSRYSFLLGNAGLTILQLYWFSLIWKAATQELGGAKPKNN